MHELVGAVWTTAMAFYALSGPSTTSHVLDAFGRWASLGILLGMALTVVEGAWLFLQALSEAQRVRMSTVVIAVIGSLLFPIV